MKLSFDEIDALNMVAHWFGGSMNRMDTFVASIDTSIMSDLVDEGLLRKKFFGWEITRKGRQQLAKRDITRWTDTRS